MAGWFNMVQPPSSGIALQPGFPSKDWCRVKCPKETEVIAQPDVEDAWKRPGEAHGNQRTMELFEDTGYVDRARCQASKGGIVKYGLLQPIQNI